MAGKSTPIKDRVCGANEYGLAYCGTRNNAGVSTNWANVTCGNCQAARRADEAASGLDR